jgi:hypothetical protein
VKKRWYVLIHLLPPRPIYLRAKIGQRLARVGAVALKNSVYVLPKTADCLEDFQWIAEEARTGGGEAHVAEAAFVGEEDRLLVRRFTAERDADYKVLAAEAKKALAAWRRRGPADGKAPAALPLARLNRRLSEVRAIDFFGAPGRRGAETAVHSLETAMKASPPASRPGTGGKNRLPSGRTWVTRRDVHVDRIASAWLIRRFLDRRARFRFLDPEKVAPKPGEIGFDIVGGEFTHEGDRCTFETLLTRTGRRDPALTAIAEIVHDIDLKDGKFGREDVAGVGLLVDGIIRSHRRDEDRLARGAALFDDLYASFRGQS